MKFSVLQKRLLEEPYVTLIFVEQLTLVDTTNLKKANSLFRCLSRRKY
jgi:hypothetical protein